MNAILHDAEHKALPQYSHFLIPSQTLNPKRIDLCRMLSIVKGHWYLLGRSTPLAAGIADDEDEEEAVAAAAQVYRSLGLSV